MLRWILRNKNAKNRNSFQRLASSGCATTPIWLQIDGNWLPNDPPTGSLVSIFIQLEPRLQPNIGNTVRSVLMAFTSSRIALPKMHRFRWNLEHSENIFRDWPWHILSAIRAEQELDSEANFCRVNNARHYRFPVGQISRNLNITRRSVSCWILSEKKFENYLVRGRLKKQNVNFSTSARHNSAMIIDRRKFITKWSVYEMSYLRSDG